MAVATSNRLLPLLAGALVLMLAFVTLKSCTGEQQSSLFMGQFPASGIKINGELKVDVNGDAGAGWHEDRIEALGLAFQKPL